MVEQITLRDSWGNLAVTLSCKAVAMEEGKLWLRRNERDEWELPGGRLEEHEQPEETVVRELHEEIGVVELSDLGLVDMTVWKKEFGTNTHVGIVIFRCNVLRRDDVFEHDSEGGHASFQQFTVEDALELPDLPRIYKRALRKL